ncbi:MAG: peptide-methionine (S)-S-oxide reductase MsrA [Intrasporangium sp.]|uniref:peptide-methionine (S)-S-oxide reductase MsrA n=1 Tax=Intrasporangium sp. TaxID=1925024 RepID=UPI003F7D2105
MPAREEALPGRAERPYAINPTHVVLGTPVEGPWPEGSEVIFVGMGCFWGVERIFWRQPGVVATAAGYMGGYTPNPTYEEVCTGMTGHAEIVRVVYDTKQTSPELLLKQFWENHDPTTANRQGNDVGTGYRSAIYWTTPEQERAAIATRDAFQKVLHEHGHGEITTEIRSAEEAGPFYVAEDYHQGYLHKNPMGYCNHGPNGMTCPVGIVRQDEVPSQESVVRSDG